MHLKKKGQGATEYLVLLAVVLVIALVSISLLGFFPGMANEQALEQNQIYWKNQQPIAILDGIGKYDTVVMTLQNTGSRPIELIAVTTNSADNAQEVDPSAEYGSYFNDTSSYRFFSPGVLAGGSYTNIIYPPKGVGFAQYNQQNILQPGETMTVGFTYQYMPGSYDANGAKLCYDQGERTFQKQMEYSDFTIYYATVLRTGNVVKTERGRLILPCDMTPPPS